MNTTFPAIVVLTLLLPITVVAQSTSKQMMHTGHTGNMDHSAMMAQQVTSMQAKPKEGGQSAFAAIQEIASILNKNPDTDWSQVNLERLRLHLIDMDNVTLHAKVRDVALPNGMQYTITSSIPDVTASIQNMVMAHVETMNGAEGWTLSAEKIDVGAILSVNGPDTDLQKIKALGFIGLMTLGAHHQAHHFALALGNNPH